MDVETLKQKLSQDKYQVELGTKGRGLTELKKEEIEALIAERQQARKDRNFALADKIRDDLKGRGIELLDTPQGVRWKKVD